MSDIKMTEIERIKKSIESTVTVFVGQDENEQGIVISKQSLYYLITTLESQEENIENLQINANDWEDEYMKMKRRFEGMDKSALETFELLKESNTLIESQKEEIAELLRVNSVKSQQLFENDLEISLLEKDIQDCHKHYKDKIESLKAITELAVKGLKEINAEYMKYIENEIECDSSCWTMDGIAETTLSEIERLSHELDK